MMRPSQAAPAVVLLLLLAAALCVEAGCIGRRCPQAATGTPSAPHSSARQRHLLAAPLRVRLYLPYYGAWYWFEDQLRADIAAVDEFAFDNGQQRMEYRGYAEDSVVTSELEAGNIDVLLVFSENPAVFSTDAVEGSVSAALANGKLKKLMVWHSFRSQAVDARVPGLPNGACSDRYYNWNIATNNTLYGTAGPAGLTGQTVDGVYAWSFPAAYGHCNRDSIMSLPSATPHTWVQGFQGKLSAFSYCYGGQGSVFYSTTFMSWVLYNHNEYNACRWAGGVCFSWWVDDFEYWSPGVRGQLAELHKLHVNAMYAFIYKVEPCFIPLTCPPSPVLSAAWLPPNNKMTNVSLAAVPTFDPRVPGYINITGVQYYDSTLGKQPTFPLATWPAGGAADTAVVALRAQRNGAGQGRLYRIQYTASNQGGSCPGVAYLCVPHDASAFDPLTTAERAALFAVPAPSTADKRSPTTAPAITPPGCIKKQKRKASCPGPSSIQESQWMSTQQP